MATKTESLRSKCHTLWLFPQEAQQVTFQLLKSGSWMILRDGWSGTILELSARPTPNLGGLECSNSFPGSWASHNGLALFLHGSLGSQFWVPGQRSSSSHQSLVREVCQACPTVAPRISSSHTVLSLQNIHTTKEHTFLKFWNLLKAKAGVDEKDHKQSLPH